MKNARRTIFVAACLLIAGTLNSVMAQTTPAQTNQWFNSLSWLNGLNRKPTGNINKAEFAKQYKSNKARWDLAFKYLKETDLSTLKPGRYPLDGDNVYLNITEVSSKDKDSVMFEAHKNYADIHCVVSGEEQIGIAPYASCVLKKEYDPVKDIAFYTSAKGKYYVSNSTTIFILFPEKDAHCGAIKVKESVIVKKVVVKVRTS